MKHTLITIMIAVVGMLVVASTSSAHHSPPPDDSGNFFGSVFQNGIDADGDGLNGRSGTLRVRDSVFKYADVNIDVTINFANPQGNCPAGEIELFPSGEISLSTWSGDGALFLQIDPTKTICSGARPEVVHLNIGVFDAQTQQVLPGKGTFANASGTARFYLPSDAQLRSGPVIGEPQVVYVHDGSFEIDYD